MAEHEWDRRSVDFPLTPESVVLEVGGYKARWAKLIAERYAPQLYIFEPQRWAYDHCLLALAHWIEAGSARVFNYGLGLSDQPDALMGDYETDGASYLKQQAPKGPAPMREAGAVFDELGLARIDLMLINIEGYEYHLVPHLQALGLLTRVRWLMIQFHTFAAEPPEHQALLNSIERTHEPIWSYGTTLMAWRRIDDWAEVVGHE